MQNFDKYLQQISIISLAFVFSATLILGAIVAPVVFHSSEYITGVTLGRFSNGELMSEIFRRFSLILNFVVLFVIAIEAKNYKTFFKNGIFVVLFSLFILSALLFSFYFTPFVLGLLHQGEAVINQNLEAFETLHKLSEIDFTVLMFSSLVMFFYKLNAYRVHSL